MFLFGQSARDHLPSAFVSQQQPVHLRLLRLDVTTRDDTSAEHRHQLLSELLAGQQVQVEVNGMVEVHHQLSNRACEAVHANLVIAGRSEGEDDDGDGHG